MPLRRLFAAAFEHRRGHVGLEWMGERFTFADLDARADRMANILTDRGLRAGDRLAIYVPNRLEVIDLYLACTRLGIVYVPINVLYRGREIDHIVRDAHPAALVSGADPPVSVPVQLWDVGELARDADARPSIPLDRGTLEPTAAAAIIYTSGTTGAAKGAVLTHANFASNAARLIAAWRITDRDRLLLALPLFHVHGLGNGLHCWLGSGARMRLLPRFDAVTAPAALEQFEATLFFGVPTMYVRLLEAEPELARRIGDRMRLFVSGSAPLPVAVLEQFRERFGHTILERYGMTEALMILGNPLDGERRAGTVGLPLPGVEVSLRDDDEAGRAVSGDGTGEIFVKSDAVFREYLGRPQDTAAAFVDGWFRTGDLAVRSADGYYTLRGRRSDVIISGGFNIYPREIEEWLLEQEGVADATVVGTPDPVRGEVPLAYVVPAPGARLDASKLEIACRDQFASFKVPRRIIVTDGLPRTALGKVQRHLLKPDWASRARGRAPHDNH